MTVAIADVRRYTIDAPVPLYCFRSTIPTSISDDIKMLMYDAFEQTHTTVHINK